MHRNTDLYKFFMEKSWDLTEDWYKNLDRSDPIGVYSSKDPAVIDALKQQNYKFHKNFFEIFNKEESVFFANFEKWIIEVAQDEEHIGTPLEYILREFFRTQNQYLDLIGEYTEIHQNQYSKIEIESWQRMVIKVFSEVVLWYTEEYNKYSQQRLRAQQELILELSSPVIALNRQVALLPLIGDIDTVRAKIMLENTLEQCAKLGINQLLLDLSGVVLIDTMVAHQIFKLVEALTLLGVKTTLSGLRPEIAQTAVQLGLSFEDISITSTLSKAIKSANVM